MIKRNLPTLKIHKLKYNQYNEIKDANAINDNEIYEITDAAVITDSEKAGYDSHIADVNIHVTADEKAVWNEKDVFIAIYGTTTNAEIEEAYQSGKTIVLNLSGTIIIPFLFSRHNATKHMFAFMFGDIVMAINITVVENDVWNEQEAHTLAYTEEVLLEFNEVNNSLNTKANKSTISTSTMSASGWSNGVYSFESTYPVATYDIEIALDSTATATQAEAFNGALIAGSATSNVVKAYGIVPTVDIPICIKVVMK